MAKPIFLIGVPKDDEFTIKELENGNPIMDSYHVVMFRQTKEIDFTFQVLNAADLTPLQFEELKQTILNTINENEKQR